MFGLILTEFELSAKRAELILQAGLLTRMENEYSGIVSIMEIEWKIGCTNIAESTQKLIWFAKIRKDENQAWRQTGTPQQSAFLTSKLAKPSNRAPLGTCTNPDCIKSGNTTHYTDRCFLKYPELRPKHSLHQMRTKGSRQNLLSQTTESPSDTPTRESWQPKVLAVKRPRNASWLVNIAADVHVCNNRSLMTEYHERPT